MIALFRCNGAGVLVVEWLIVIGVILMIATVLLHSLLGELRLIAPLMRAREGVLASPRARFLIRFSWHLVSFIALALGLVLLALVYRPEIALKVALGLAGVVFLLAGIIDGVVTRGTHIGWPFLTAIGVVLLAALAVNVND